MKSEKRMRKHLIKRISLGSLAMLYYPNNTYATALRYFHEDLRRTRGLMLALKETGYHEHQRILSQHQVKVIEEFLGEA